MLLTLTITSISINEAASGCVIVVFFPQLFGLGVCFDGSWYHWYTTILTNFYDLFLIRDFRCYNVKGNLATLTCLSPLAPEGVTHCAMLMAILSLFVSNVINKDLAKFSNTLSICCLQICSIHSTRLSFSVSNCSLSCNETKTC